MAARKPRVTAPGPSTELDAQVRAELHKQFLERLRNAVSWDGGLIKVDCDVEGYEGVSVWFNTENTFEVASLYAIARSLPISIKDQCHLVSLFVRRVEWPFNIPEPTPDDLVTYEPLLMQFRSLAEWVQVTGYKAAKDARWGNASRPSEKS